LKLPIKGSPSQRIHILEASSCTAISGSEDNENDDSTVSSDMDDSKSKDTSESDIENQLWAEKSLVAEALMELADPVKLSGRVTKSAIAGGDAVFHALNACRADSSHMYIAFL
jgi:hypothetical protein